jgi:hypothetical protein
MNASRTAQQDCAILEAVNQIGLAAIAERVALRLLFAGLGDIHLDRPIIQHFLIQHIDGVLRLFVAGHGYEGETLHTARITIFDHVYRNHGPGLAERSSQAVFGSIIGKVSNIQSGVHFILHLPSTTIRYFPVKMTVVESLVKISKRKSRHSISNGGFIMHERSWNSSNSIIPYFEAKILKPT